MFVPRARASRRFLTWRAIYGAGIGILSASWIVIGSDDVGTEPAWWLLVLGLVPTICVLASAIAFPSRVYAIALAHDLTLLVMLTALLILLPNYLALVLLSPLALLILEGCVLAMGSICMLRERRARQDVE